MDIKLYNSLTNKLETFKPIKENEVSMYVCGSTVYDSPHIGNLRPLVAFDILRRLFIYLGYKVTYVSNYTDIDDKIINKAIKENVGEMIIANRYIEEINKLVKDINTLKADINPRVSEYIDKIIEYVDLLIKKGNAYVVDGDVYFSVESISNYGELANINIEDLKIGARIEEDKKKKSPLDFALWKKTDVGINFDSPWGKGRPGWHTECCVMIDSIFPEGKIDIHGGGFDLKFPHHENEIAQNKASHNNKLANYWIHNGFVTFGDSKMSKSLGNVVLAKDAIAKYGAEIVRLTLLSAHYRAPIKFTEETIDNAKNNLLKIKNTYNKLAISLQIKGVDLSNLNRPNIEPFIDALKDDMNVSNAETYLFETIKVANNLLRDKNASIELMAETFSKIKDMLSLLGLHNEYKKLSRDDLDLLNKYNESKINKDFKTSDLLRAELIKRNLL